MDSKQYFYSPLLRLLIVFGLALFFVGCTSQPAESTATPEPEWRVALALARGGLGDKAFNDGAYAGLERAGKELGVEVSMSNFQDGDAQVANLRQLVTQGYDLIIGVGAENAPALETIAAEFPDHHFVLVDAAVDGPNITSVTFSELEGDFLAGVLSALLSESSTVGFLGGADIAVIRRIEFGWRQGVTYIKPEATILAEYAGGKDDFSGFGKPELGQELTVKMYEEGADVVYAAAGRTALGAIDAAKLQEKLIITTGSDQRWIAPEVVVTSRIKDMEHAVFNIIEQFKAGSLASGTQVLDFYNGGISLTPMDEKLVPAEVLTELERIQADLESGRITLKPFTE